MGDNAEGLSAPRNGSGAQKTAIGGLRRVHFHRMLSAMASAASMTLSEQTTDSEFLQAALNYAKHGRPVFPCNPLVGPDNKKPLTAHGFKDATCDETIIREWWTKWPLAMVGMPTGAASGMFVVDLDVSKGKDGRKKYADLGLDELDTLACYTPSGGVHLYFAHQDGLGNSSGKIADGIDTRGDGGYVCVPPSQRADGKTYEWRSDGERQVKPVPAKILELLRRQPRDEFHPAVRTGGPSPYSLAALERECADLANAGSGTRNHALNTAVFKLSQLEDLDDKLIADRAYGACIANGLVKDDGHKSVVATIKSGLQSGRRHPRQVPQTLTAARPTGHSKPNGQEHAAEDTSEQDWHTQCIRSDNGKIIPNVANVLIALRAEHPESFAFDDMKQCAVFRSNGRSIIDDDVVQIQEQIQHLGIARIAKDTVHDAIERCARENSFHPVRQYLNDLRWDGIERIDLLFPRYFGSEDKPYTREIGRRFMIAMVARIFEPGCKADYMVIIEGPQGRKKTTACEVLGGLWFSNCLPEIAGNKDAMMHLRGHWLIEVSELQAMFSRRTDTAQLKSFLTRRIEQYRPAYGRREVYEPRQCIFIGTTNQHTYLRDETGGRRFWPFVAGEIDIDALKIDRDQLFAEAVSLFRTNEPHWPDPEFEREFIEPEQQARYEEDAWEEKIHRYLEVSANVTLLDVAQQALLMECSKLGTADQRRISAAMLRLGWVHGKMDWKTRRQLWVKK